MDKSQKILLGIVLIALAATVGSSIFSSIPAASIDFWLDAYYDYEKIGTRWMTYNSMSNSTLEGVFIPINCKNNGAATATFNITVVFTGASFSTTTPQPCRQINDTAASFTFTLGIAEQKSANAYFSIDNSTDRFMISLSLETNESNLSIEPVRNGTAFYGYRNLYYTWIPEYLTYAPALIS